MSRDHPAGQFRHAAAWAAVIVTFWLTGCRAAPHEEAVRDVITAHFGSRGYRVMELDVGGISPIPLGEMTYMGTPGYEIEVRTITVEGANAGRLSFSDAHVRIREARNSRRGWAVIGVTGIPLP